MSDMPASGKISYDTGGHRLPVVLSIAGSDGSGGAGIQADLKTCMGLAVYCATAITAVTAQNPYILKSIGYVGDSMLRDQLDCIFDSVKPDAIKIGMIPCMQAAEIISKYLSANGDIPVVIDPVLSATSGGSLSGKNDNANELCRLLFPYATVITPNLPELEKLTPQFQGATTEERAIYLLNSWKPRSILVKGGHAGGKESTDTLYLLNGTSHIFSAPRIASVHTHGTGCTLSTAIACGLAKGLPITGAVEGAKQFVWESIERGARYPLFENNGPLIHFQP